MQKVQAMSLGVWVFAVLLILICGYVQAVVFRAMLKRHNREYASHVEVVACLIAAMQSAGIAEHSRRVAAISERLAMELRVPISRVPLVRAMGLLHEVKGIGSFPDQLPVEAEILAIADYFDEVACAQGEQVCLEKVIEDIRQQAGTRFQPEAIKALMRLVLRAEAGNR